MRNGPAFMAFFITQSMFLSYIEGRRSFFEITRRISLLVGLDHVKTADGHVSRIKLSFSMPEFANPPILRDDINLSRRVHDSYIVKQAFSV